MFERFTPSALRVIVLAQEESRALKHTKIGTEHLLLALTRVLEENDSDLLSNFGVTTDKVRYDLRVLEGVGEVESPGHIPFTRRAKKQLELCLRHSTAHGNNEVDLEHLVLATVDLKVNLGSFSEIAMSHRLIALRGAELSDIFANASRELRNRPCLAQANAPQAVATRLGGVGL